MSTKQSEAGKHQKECWGRLHHTGHYLNDWSQRLNQLLSRGLLSHPWCLQKGCTTLGLWARGQESWHLYPLLVNVCSFWPSPTSGRGYQTCERLWAAVALLCGRANLLDVETLGGLETLRERLMSSSASLAEVVSKVDQVISSREEVKLRDHEENAIGQLTGLPTVLTLWGCDD